MATKTTPSKQKLHQLSHNFDMSGLLDSVSASGLTDLARIPVLPPSGFVGRDGRGPFTYDIARVIANVRANGVDIPVFIDHNDQGQAFGWLDHTADPIQGTDGSWEWPIAYTPVGAALLQSRAFRYNSPTYLFIQNTAITDNQAGEVVGLLEVSLTNLPNLYLRSLNTRGAGDYTNYVTHSQQDSEQMDKTLLAELGLAEDATIEAVTAAIAALKSAAAKAAEIVEAAGATIEADVAAVIDSAANSRVTAGVLVTKQAFDEVALSLATMTTARDTAVTELATLKSSHADASATAAVDEALKAGKFTPAARDSLISFARSDRTAFDKLAATVFATVTLPTVTTHSVTDETHGLSADDLKICKMQKIDPAIFAKNKNLGRKA